MRFSLCFVVVLFWSLLSNAQQPENYTGIVNTYNQAQTLFSAKQYLAAQNTFKALLSEPINETLKADFDYYIALCAIRLNQQNADALIEKFVTDYPIHPKQTSAYLNVGDYYFNKAEYARANKWFSKVNANALSQNDQEAFNFKRAYTAFSIKDVKIATSLFTQIQNSPTYGSQSKYYLGVMAYEGDNYNAATSYFNQINTSEAYTKELSYFQADLNFKLGKFNDAISLAKEQLPNSNPQDQSELSKIIGESYFNLAKYQEAIPYLSNYKGKNGQWTNTDYYQLGYAHYKNNDYEQAVSEFNKIIDGNDFVAQNAYYHLGESYIKLAKKQEALHAFRNASRMNFDQQIKEDSWLNYAKLSYDIGNPYQSVPEVLSEYIQAYSTNANKDEMESLLVDSYVSSKNYADAYRLLKSMQGSKVYKDVFGDVAFFRGVELFNDANYNEASVVFKESISAAKTTAIKAKAQFWLAESFYQLGNYSDAIAAYNQFKGIESIDGLAEFNLYNYNIGYAYFKSKDYSNAAKFFEAFIKAIPSDDELKTDAQLRLADSYFANATYKNAVTAYLDVVNSGSIYKDYAFFQHAQSLGLLGNTSEKEKLLKQFGQRFPNSQYNDDALYDLGNLYVSLNQPEQALAAYASLEKNSPNSEFLSKAKLREGLVYYNTNRNQMALEHFKAIAKNYPNTPEANQAVATARLIYIDLGRVNEYAQWVKTLDYVTVTDADLDNSTYEAAEKQYINLNREGSKALLNSYLNQFPNGLHLQEAHFYLGELYFNDNLNANALPHYKFIVNGTTNEFTNEALYKLSQIYLEDKNWIDAAQILKRLENESEHAQNVLYAQSNLMKAYYQLNDTENAAKYAELLINNPSTNTSIKADAYLIQARLDFENKNFEASDKAYQQVEALAKGEAVAEAVYYKAVFQQKREEFEASNQTIQHLIKDYASYKFYGARGLIAMAQNFYELNDAFQATYILESVIENFSNYEALTAQAEAELERIKADASKTNSSVIIKDKN